MRHEVPLFVIILLVGGACSSSAKVSSDAALIVVDANMFDATGFDANAIDASLFLCGAPTNMVKEIFIFGASNTFACGSPCYFELVANSVREALAPCAAYAPEYEGDEMPWGTTLAISSDFTYARAGSANGLREALDTMLVTFGDRRSLEGIMLLGNVPAVPPREDVSEFNDVVAEELGKYPWAHEVDLELTYAKLRDGKLQYDGVVLEISDVLPDGLHFSELGNQVTADVFLVRLNELFPELRAETYGQLVYFP